MNVIWEVALLEYRLAQNQSLLVYIPYNPKNGLAKGVYT